MLLECFQRESEREREGESRRAGPYYKPKGNPKSGIFKPLGHKFGHK